MELQAELARLEGRIALEVLSQRLPHLRLKPYLTYTHRPSRLLRGYRELLAVWDLK